MIHLTYVEKQKFVAYLAQEIADAEQFIRAAEHLPENMRKLYVPSKEDFIRTCQRMKAYIEWSESTFYEC